MCVVAVPLSEYNTCSKPPSYDTVYIVMMNLMKFADIFLCFQARTLKFPHLATFRRCMALVCAQEHAMSCANALAVELGRKVQECASAEVEARYPRRLRHGLLPSYGAM